MVSAINNGGGFYRPEVYVHEARMSGAVIINPCINLSEFKTTLYGKDVYLGLLHIEKLESKTAHLTPEERKVNRDYLSLENFVKRVPIGIETLQILIFIGAFRFTGKQKHELLIEARFLLAEKKTDYRHLTLFEEPQKNYKLFSPFDMLQTKYRGHIMAKELTKYHKKQVKMLAYLISRKHVPTKRGTMYFGTWVDADGEYFDTAHFPDNLSQYPFQGGGCYLLLGTVEVDFHFPTITVMKMAKMPFIPDPRYSSHKEKAFEAYNNIREDVSMTWRKPYPQEHEIGLPRMKMK